MKEEEKCTPQNRLGLSTDHGSFDMKVRASHIRGMTVCPGAVGARLQLGQFSSLNKACVTLMFKVQ